MEIRRLNLDDVALLKGASNDFKDGHLSLDQANKFLKCDTNYFAACIDNNKVAGFLLAYRLQRYDGAGDMVYIHEVEVKEAYRRKGVGKMLIEHMKSICIEKKFSKMYVITNKSNLAAMGLYSSTGASDKNDDDIVFEYRV